MKLMRLVTLVVFLAVAHGADEHSHEHDEHSHDHDEHSHEHEDHAHEDGEHAHEEPWEWAGTFETPQSLYVWSAQSVDYEYADPSMKILLLAASEVTSDGLHALESVAETAFEGSCSHVHEGEIIALGVCQKLEFDQSKHTSTFTINATVANRIAIFAEHLPTEFERDRHYLKDQAGEDVEPVFQEPDPGAPEEKDKHWGEAIGASFLVVLCTLTGVAFLAPRIAEFGKKYGQGLAVGTNAFAAGALMAAAFYLMLFEATHLIVPISPEEGAQAAYWGSAVLLGFVTSMLIEFTVAAVTGYKLKEEPTTTRANDAVEARDVNVKVDRMDSPYAVPSNRLRVLTGVLVGDFMHNMVDGIVIGVAFSGCGQSVGWSITASTIYHELAQEVADYLVLTDPMMGALNPLTALALNFVSGLSIVLGAIIMLSQDSVSDDAQALLLAYGGGIYIQIAATECLPRMLPLTNSNSMRVLALFFFTLGAVAIGVVLLDHEHCFPTGEHGHGHGHGHGH